MKKFLLLIALCTNAAHLLPAKKLVNERLVSQHLTKEAHWASLHGAAGNNLGASLLYYALVYSAKAKTCVCLGSGDGFVPRIMRQAQRDLNLEGSRTILVDGNMGKWGRPLWLRKNSFFRTHYPDIEIILDSTKNVALSHAQKWQINYLHIDADRTTKGALQDFLDYLPFMAKRGIITLHDTGKNRPCSQTVALIKNMGYDVINFETFGTGVACIALK